MDANVVIATGFPHQLLGLLRRMPGIDDLSLIQDADKLIKTFSETYPEEDKYIFLIDKVCNLGIIAEMASILEEPMWRKRSFINKALIQLMYANDIKEYQACEIMESFMQIFGWDFEIRIARRWSAKEEETNEYYKENNGGTYTAGKVKKNTSGSNEVEYKSQDIVVENDVTNDLQDENIVNSEATVKNAESTVRHGHYYTEQAETRPARRNANNKKKRNEKKNDLQHIKEKSLYNTKQDVLIETKQYADEDKIYDMHAYIQNEILKGGIKFENLMSNVIKRDVAKAIKGNSEAQYRMGKYYSESNTKHTDYEEALKWYRVSASQGNKKAQFELGMLYDGGKVKCKDYKKQALNCYRGLAESGFPTAQCMLGMKYKFGDGVDEDLNEAIKWFKKAAVQGHTDAQRNLGDTYMAIGKKSEAMKWYERAAAAGDIYCEKLLGNRP